MSQLKSDKFSPEQISATGGLFSSKVVNEMARGGKSAVFSRLAKESSLLEILEPEDSVSKVFNIAFDVIRSSKCRNEYIYKSAITHKLLLGVHSLRTASMVTEFRVGSSKADVIILNGTSTVYEIKSERDNLARLESQIASYQRVFATINVITGQNHANDVISKTSENIGVLVLNDKYQISTLRPAREDSSEIDSNSIFQSLRLSESEKILGFNGMEVENVPNTIRHRLVEELFSRLPANKAHTGMLTVLRETRSLLPVANFISALPNSLRAIGCSMRFNKKEKEHLLSAVMTPISEALTWC